MCQDPLFQSYNYDDQAFPNPFSLRNTVLCVTFHGNKGSWYVLWGKLQMKELRVLLAPAQVFFITVFRRVFRYHIWNPAVWKALGLSRAQSHTKACCHGLFTNIHIFLILPGICFGSLWVIPTPLRVQPGRDRANINYEMSWLSVPWKIKNV